MTTLPEPLQRHMDSIRKAEGIYYGDGTASLITEIVDELLKAGDRKPPYVLATQRQNPMDPRLITDTILKVLRKRAEAIGMRPDIEVSVGYPETPSQWNRDYYVGWESGPSDWAIQASFAIMEVTGRLIEPYHGFDLCIYENE